MDSGCCKKIISKLKLELESSTICPVWVIGSFQCLVLLRKKYLRKNSFWIRSLEVSQLCIRVKETSMWIVKIKFHGSRRHQENWNQQGSFCQDLPWDGEWKFLRKVYGSVSKKIAVSQRRNFLKPKVELKWVPQKGEEGVKTRWRGKKEWGQRVWKGVEAGLCGSTHFNDQEG